MARVIPPGPKARGLKRDPALVPLSRDHHFALRQALWLRRAAAGTDLVRAGQVARDFVAFHRDELVPHMREEEEIVFPPFEPHDPAGTARLRDEHRAIHGLAGRLQAAVEGSEDPRGLMGEIAALLDDHIRYEERDYFMAVQDRLSPEVLKAMGDAIARRPRTCPTG
jgi:hypothetical protein